MKITLAPSAGFCFGVRRAITMALGTPRNGRKVFMLGDIVHNEHVVAMIRKAGIKKIGRLHNGKGKTLIIRAHGASRQTIARAQREGFTVIDATCPMVKEIHTIVRTMEKEGYRIIVIGDRRHEEVRGITGQLRQKALVIEPPCPRLPSSVKRIAKAAVVSQSTQDINQVLEIVGRLKGAIKKIRFFNTICMTTRKKQEEIHRLPKENDVVIVIGSKTSANTKRLYAISRAINPHTHLINLPSQIKKTWFLRAKRIGITAGASTPDASIIQVIARIKKITRG